MTNLRSGGGHQLRSHMDFAALRTRLRFEHGPAVLSDAEQSATALADVEKDIEDCDAEIYRLHSRIIFIQNQRRRLEEYKACLRSIGSLNRKIPNETLLRVFDLACDMNEITSKDVSTMPALVISGVCFRWRNLAQSSPDLWSRIRIEMQTSPPSLFTFPVLDFFLSFSRSSPLTFEITGNTRSLEPHHLAMCNTLIEHCNRWQEVVIVLGVNVLGVNQIQEKVYNALTSQDSGHYPMLETLRCPLLKATTSHLDRFQNAPKLSRLSAGYIHEVNLAKSKFPWKQLTQLSFAQSNVTIWHLWKICDKLRVLNFGEPNSGLGLPRLQPIVPPTLTELTLNICQTAYPASESLAKAALSAMTCSSLTSLIIVARDEYTRPWPQKCLRDFISRSSCGLTTLSIKFIPLSDAHLIDVLYCVPPLLHLTIDDSKLPHIATSLSHNPSPITPKLVQSLHAFPRAGFTAGSSALVPKLQSLNLTCAGYAFDDEAFIDMVSSRWLHDHNPDASSTANPSDSDVGTACLRSVVLRFKNRELNEKQYRPMAHLEKAGMRVVLIGKNSV